MTAEPEKNAPAPRHALPTPVVRTAEWSWSLFVRIMPGPIRRKLETDAGVHFSRFIPVAIAAVLASQITLAILTGANMTAGKAALIASIAGAAVSYLLSRWAWGRKGRPDLLRETVPFWLVSFAVWGFLSLVSHYAGAWAKAEHLHHLEKHLTVQGAYFAANCITFVCRFLIFHYVLFTDKRRPAAAAAAAAAPAANPPEAVTPELAAASASAGSEDTGPMALSGESTAAHRRPKA